MFRTGLYVNQENGDVYTVKNVENSIVTLVSNADSTEDTIDVERFSEKYYEVLN